MLTLFLPEHHLEKFMAISIDRVDATLDDALAGHPIIAASFDNTPFIGVQNQIPGIRVTMNKPCLEKGGHATLAIKWRATLGGPGQYWSGNMKLRLSGPRSPWASSYLTSCRTTRSSIRTEGEIYAKGGKLLQGALSMLCDENLVHQTCVDPVDFKIVGDSTGISDTVPGMLAAALQNHRRDIAAKPIAMAKVRDLMSSLPDGTPLILRSTNSRTWQLAIKTGRLSQTHANNTMIAPEALLRNNIARIAGLSMHDILDLDARARAALQSHPQAAKFQIGDEDISKGYGLHPGQPLHATYTSRKDTPATIAWMATRETPHSGFRFEIEGGNSLIRIDCMRRPQRNIPPYPGPDHMQVALRDRSGRLGADRDPHPFMRAANLWCISAATARILRGHDITGIALNPLNLIRDDGTLWQRGWFCIALHNTLGAVVAGLCDPDVLKYVGGRAVQPHEILIDADRVGSRDIWWDAGVRNGTLFLSDRLHSALKKARCAPHLAFKPCAAA